MKRNWWTATRDRLPDLQTLVTAGFSSFFATVLGKKLGIGGYWGAFLGVGTSLAAHAVRKELTAATVTTVRTAADLAYESGSSRKILPGIPKNKHWMVL